LLDTLGIGTEVGDGAANFGLRKRDANLHGGSVPRRSGRGRLLQLYRFVWGPEEGGVR
jgi:hypothetical protein